MIHRFVEFELDTQARQLRYAGEPLLVPRRVFDCLACLLERRERAVSREELIRCVWGRDNVSDNQLAQVILRARRTLGGDGQSQWPIRTVPGFGYHWVAELQSVQPLSACGASPARARRGRSAALAAAAVLALTSAGLLLWVGGRQSASDTPRALAVLPAELAEGARAEWARYGLMAVVGARLRGGGLATMPIEQVLVRLGDAASGADVDAGAAARLEADTLRVQAEPLESGWRVRLQLDALHTRPLHISASDADLVAAAEAASDALLQALGQSAPAPDAGAAVATHAAAPFADAQRALRRNDFDGARAALARLPIDQRGSLEAALLDIEIALASGLLERSGQRLAAFLERADLDPHSPEQARALLLRNQLARRLGQPEPEAALDRLVERLETLPAPQLLARALQQRGSREVGAGRPEAAERDFLRAHQLFSALGEPVDAGAASGNLALLLMLRGRHVEALAQLEEVAQVYREHGDVGRLFNTYSSISSLEVGRLRWREALAASDAAAALLPLVEDASSRQRHFRPRALAMLALGRLDEAESLLERAEIEGERGEPNPDTHARQGLYVAQLALARQQPQRAAEAALAVLRPLHARFGAALEPRVRTDARDLALLLVVQAELLDAQLSGSVPAPLPEPAEALLAEAGSILSLVARARWRVRPGNADEVQRVAAAADLQQAQVLAEEFGRMSRRLLVAEARIELLLAQAEADRANEVLQALLAQDPGLAERDFDAAVLLLRLHLAQGGAEPIERALASVEALRGQRPMPPGLPLGGLRLSSHKAPAHDAEPVRTVAVATSTQ